MHWPAKMGSGIKLGKGKVKPGMPHTTQVQKINESDPGPWSKSIIVHMPATPSRPSQPRIELTSHEQGTLTVRRLSQEEEHGSSAKALIVETCIPPSKEWTSREVEINPNMGHPIQADVKVEPDITQYFSQNVCKAAAEATGLDAVSLPDGAVHKFKRALGLNKKGGGRKSLTSKDQFELSSTETDPFLARRHAGAGHKTTLPKMLPMT